MPTPQLHSTHVTKGDSLSTVLIAASEFLAPLKERVGSGGEVISFDGSDSLRALEVITQRRPKVVALERLFAATSRGAALISRLRSDPSLSQSEIRVVSHDSDYSRVVSRQPEPAPAQPLDWHGTRRAPRFKMREGVEALVDGNPVTLVDLSVVGAQVISLVVLRPNQRVRMALPQEDTPIRFGAAVAWAFFELPPRAPAPRYRAGVEFSNADPHAVEQFCNRRRKKD